MSYPIFHRPTTKTMDRKLEQSQRAICKNLSYSLDQLALSSDADAYMSIFERIVVGPCNLKDTELELCLGIQSDLLRRRKMKGGYLKDRFGLAHSESKGIQGEWGEHIGGPVNVAGYSYFKKSENKKQTETEIEKGKTKRNREKTFIVEKSTMADHLENCQNIKSQFELFSKFGDSGSSGRQITLSQSDRWLRQAKVIDGWNLTTIDTAIAIRKISKGSIWL